jgi:hypothetical protein
MLDKRAELALGAMSTSTMATASVTMTLVTTSHRAGPPGPTLVDRTEYVGELLAN